MFTCSITCVFTIQVIMSHMPRFTELKNRYNNILPNNHSRCVHVEKCMHFGWRLSDWFLFRPSHFPTHDFTLALLQSHSHRHTVRPTHVIHQCQLHARCWRWPWCVCRCTGAYMIVRLNEWSFARCVVAFSIQPIISGQWLIAVCAHRAPRTIRWLISGEWYGSAKYRPLSCWLDWWRLACMCVHAYLLGATHAL